MRTFWAPVALVAVTACGSSSSSSGAQPGRDAGEGDASQVSLDAMAPQAGPDGAAGIDAGADASEGGSADGSQGPILTAPDDTWTWIPLAGMRCGNGSPTGIGLNPHAGATHLLLYLQGGGACYDAASCWGSSPTASNMTGYGATSFASDPTTQAEIFQRASAGNPFHDATMVFVPYCTGDIHVGTGLATYTVGSTATPTFFVGATNVDAVVASLSATYPGLSRVFLTGVSAGGFGSFLNQDAVARALPGVPVDVVDDSGPVVAGGVPPDWKARFPPGCTGCTDAPGVFAYVRKTYPDTRYGFLTFQTDTVLPQFYGQTDAAFAKVLSQFVSSLAADPNARAFVDESKGHVVLAETDAKAAPHILPWLTQLATGDPAWASVSY